MAVNGADRQRAYLERQRTAAAQQTEELLELRAEVAALRKRNTELEAALRTARQERAKSARSSRDLGRFLWPTAKR